MMQCIPSPVESLLGAKARGPRCGKARLTLWGCGEVLHVRLNSNTFQAHQRAGVEDHGLSFSLHAHESYHPSVPVWSNVYIGIKHNE